MFFDHIRLVKRCGEQFAELVGNGRPVAKSAAKHNNQTAKNGSADAIQGLETVLHLSISMRVMRRTNLWAAEGLVNGALGTVRDILYEKRKTANY